MQAGQWVVASRITTGIFLLTKFRENSRAVGNSNSSVTVEPRYKSVYTKIKFRKFLQIVSNWDNNKSVNMHRDQLLRSPHIVYENL